MDYIEFRTIPVNYGDEQALIASECNSITFLNSGTSVVTIDNTIILQQNQEYVVPGNIGEITRQQFNVKYDNAGINQITVIRKIYV